MKPMILTTDGLQNMVARLGGAGDKAAYDTYCSVMEDELNTLYEEVENDFSTF